MSFTHRFFQKILSRLAVLICRHPTAILAICVLATFISGYVAASRFKVINNISQLLDQNSSLHQNYMEFEKEFGTDEVYLVLIQSPNPVENRKVAEKVGSHLQSLAPFISRVYCKMDFSKLQDRFLLLASKADLQEIDHRIASNLGALAKTTVPLDLNSVLDEANRRFDDKALRKKESWKEFKPFIERFKGLLNQLADQIEGKNPKASHLKKKDLDLCDDIDGQDIDSLLEERKFVSFHGGRALLVVGVRGKTEEHSVSPYTQTVARIRQYLEQLHQEHPDVKLGLTGEPVLNEDELQTSTHDTELASIITLTLIALLFFFGYRKLERPIWAGLVLGMAMAWTFAFTMLAIGHFNIISFAVIPMVLGLGIDFGIQILGRYEEEVHHGRPIQEALGRTLSITGAAVLTGGSTTAAAFFTLCFNAFLGLRELGMIAGTSILFCLFANLVALPAIFVLRDRRRSPELLSLNAADSWPFLAPLDRAIVRFPRSALLTTLLLSILSIYGVFRVKFDYNLLHLQNPKMDSVRVLHELFQVSENSTLFASVVANNLAEARSLERKLMALPSVARVESITHLLPEDQEEKLPIIRHILSTLNQVKLDTNVADKVDVERARHDLTNLLEACRKGVVEAQKFQGISKQAREAVEIFDGLIPPLERAQKAMSGLSQTELGNRLNRSQIQVFGTMKRNLAWMKSQKADRIIGPQDLPEEIASRFVSPRGKILLQVYSKEDIWEREPNRRFVTELRTVAPQVTGTPVQNFEYIELLRTSFLDAAGWAFLAIAVLIFLHFQSPKLVILAIFPLVLAVLWRTGLMGWCDLPFNPANVITLPLIIGIDVAYGVYIVDRFREDKRITIFSTSTGKAIIMTGLASLFGFVSLLISRYEGMHSIGLLMSMGIVIGMITTILILPQALQLLTRPARSSSKPESQENRN